MPTYERKINEHTLPNGWKVWVADYLTQGEFSQIQAIFLRDLEVDVETRKTIGRVKAEAKLEADAKTRQLAIKKIQTPDGIVYEGETLTPEAVESLPYDPESDVALSKILDELGKKKLTTPS